MIPPKCSNHLTECKKGAGIGNTRLLPRAKMLLVPKIVFSGGYVIFWVLFFEWANVNFAACFILRGHDTHIDFLRILFLVGMICPLMQEHFLRPLLKRKSLPLRLNKSFRLFSLLQTAYWIWIAKSDILLSRECDGFLQFMSRRAELVWYFLHDVKFSPKVIYSSKFRGMDYRNAFCEERFFK